MAQSESTRFSYAPQSAMLFALFMDGFEVGRLNESVSELIQHVIGGRNTLTYAPEITLFSRLLYYSCSLMSFGRTPGQAFCDFVLTGSVSSENKDGQSRELVRKLQRTDMATIAALYSILPYLLQRKDVIYRNIVAVLEILTKPEDLGSPLYSATSTMDAGTSTTTSTTNSEAANTTAPTNTPTNTTTNTSTTATSSAPPLDSYFAKALRALHSSVTSISTSSSERMEVVYKYAADVHRLLFLQYGSYLELPLRIMQVRMITQSPNRNQSSSLKALGWLVGFRLSLLTYYAARVVLSEVDKELHRSSSCSSGSGNGGSGGGSGGGISSSGGRDSGVNSAQRSTNTTNTASSRRCSLCIDALTSPAVVPCGHIFCWSCIVPYATNVSIGTSTSDDSSAISGSSVKCPICRTEFKPQNIRTLNNYTF